MWRTRPPSRHPQPLLCEAASPSTAHDSRIAEKQAGELEGLEAGGNQAAASNDGSKLKAAFPVQDVGDQDLDRDSEPRSLIPRLVPIRPFDFSRKR